MAARFPAGVSEKLQVYVYRLIDPRNGHTFYVGKGQGDRVFQHAQGVVPDNDSSGPAKLQRIKEIIASGFAVAHVIHRHGLDEKTAFEVEAALMDAFPGLTNLVGGHGSDVRGAAHADEIIQKYKADAFVPMHRILLISVGVSFDDEALSIYNATRFAWKIDPNRARQAQIVLAHRRGIVIAVFQADAWLPATRANFPGLSTSETADRWGFVGQDAPEHLSIRYLGKRVPDDYRRRGAANPIRFIDPLSSHVTSELAS